MRMAELRQQWQQHACNRNERLRHTVLARSLARCGTTLAITIHWDFSISVAHVLRMPTILHRVHGNVQERTAAEEQQDASGKLSAHALW